MPYGGIYFCANLMSTSCLSVRLFVECITDFRCSFLSNYSSQMLEILAHSLFWHTKCGIHFCANPRSAFSLSVWLSVESITNFHHSFLSKYSSQVVVILAYSLFWHTIRWDSFLIESDVWFLFIRVFVHRAYEHVSNVFTSERGYFKRALAHRRLVCLVY
jgi:hypothetical protein